MSTKRRLEILQLSNKVSVGKYERVGSSYFVESEIVRVRSFHRLVEISSGLIALRRWNFVATRSYVALASPSVRIVIAIFDSPLWYRPP